MCWRVSSRERTFKKNTGLINSREVVQKFKDKYPAKVLSKALGISLSRVYYLTRDTRKPKRSRKVKDYSDVVKLIESLVQQYPAYGYRKVFAVLKYRYGLKISRNKVYELMKERKLLLPPRTSRKKLFKGVPMSLKVATDESNKLWGIDMTQIWCGEDGWGYLHAVIDHHDRVLLGYNFSLSCKAIGAVMAISEAASERPVEKLELRSDNGCHYGARIFRDETRRMGIRQTRTMVNTPKGNAVIERFFRSLKEECVWQYQFHNFKEAKVYVDAYIKHYNEERPHQSLKYKTPYEFYAEKVDTENVRKIA